MQYLDYLFYWSISERFIVDLSAASAHTYKHVHDRTCQSWKALRPPSVASLQSLSARNSSRLATGFLSAVTANWEVTFAVQVANIITPEYKTDTTH